MRASVFTFIARWVLPGFIAGVVFLMIALLAGALGTTVWAMPDAIAQTVGINAPAGYGFMPVPVLLGIAVHLALSIGFGIIFIAIIRWWRLHGWALIGAGLLFSSIETATTIWVVLHNLLSAATFLYFLGAVPLLGSVLGHCVYGLVLGLIVAFNPFVAASQLQYSTKSRGEMVKRAASATSDEGSLR